MTADDLIGMFHCFGCRVSFMACPDCVTTIRVDPMTNRPPDVAIVDGKPVNVKPDPEGAHRSVQQAVCDACVGLRNARFERGGPDAVHIEGIWEAWRDRHRRAHA
ncbi:hypothetical protein [Streptomyces sp. NPDC048142]|uniref:hypothetical protein n=1 Tax=Streptomyces sp. NPDC048142 TaxID=3365501 RepID=UPI003723F7E0